MSKKLAEINGNFHVTHQAICNNGDFTGPLEEDIADAYVDAAQHRQEPGCRFHNIQIVTNQTTSKRFFDLDSE